MFRRPGVVVDIVKPHFSSLPMRLHSDLLKQFRLGGLLAQWQETLHLQKTCISSASRSQKVAEMLLEAKGIAIQSRA